MVRYREFVKKHIISSAPYMDEMVSHAEAKSIRPLTETIQQKSGSGFSELLASPFWRNYRTYVCPCCGAELSFSPLFGSVIKILRMQEVCTRYSTVLDIILCRVLIHRVICFVW